MTERKIPNDPPETPVVIMHDAKVPHFPPFSLKEKKKAFPSYIALIDVSSLLPCLALPCLSCPSSPQGYPEQIQKPQYIA